MAAENGSKLKKSFVDEIQSRILSGQLRPGDRLPAERDLALEMGISRTSVNQGILDLERMGFLRIVPRRGTYVADYINNATALTVAAVMHYDSTMIDAGLFRDFMDFRILVERECVRLACGRMDEQMRNRLRGAMEQLQGADGEHLADALYEYHWLLTLLSGNGAYSIAFRSFESLIRNMMEVRDRDSQEIVTAMPLYIRLTDAMCNGEQAEADTYILQIMKIASEYLERLLSERNK